VPDGDVSRQHTAEHMRAILERMQLTCV